MALLWTKLGVFLFSFILITGTKAEFPSNSTNPSLLNEDNSFSQASNTSNLSWRTAMTIGIGKMKRHFPQSRLIYVDSYAFGESGVTNPGSLTDFTILSDDPEKGTVYMDAIGLKYNSWDKPKALGNFRFRTYPTLGWPPRFDIDAANELSKLAGFLDAYDLIVLEEEGYEFSRPDEYPSWRVRLADGQVIRLGDVEEFRANLA